MQGLWRSQLVRAERGSGVLGRLVRRVSSWVLHTIVAVLAIIGLLAIVFVTLVVRAGPGLVEFEAVDRATRLTSLAVRSEVAAADGSPLAVFHGAEERVLVRYADVPVALVHAVVAIEDRHFFTHPGVDTVALARAAVRNAQAGGVVEGGSSITQQLVKNRIVGVERTLPRKAREAALALILESRMEKRAILTEYLNTVYFGADAYGVGVAAERYFAKPVQELSVPEAALLAGLIAEPSRANPFRSPEHARARRDAVLRAMVDEGHLTREAAALASAAPLPTEPTYRRPAGGAAYFVEEVRRRLLDDPRLGDDRSERTGRLLEGGLRIHTTLDPAVQTAADRAVATQVPPSPFTAALAAVDPATGAVRALVGGPAFEASPFNLATQARRQAGSAFKAVVLVAALEAGRSPDDPVDGTAPCVLRDPGTGQPWQVDNYDGVAGGIVPLREALARSLNCAFARVALEVGPERVADAARRLGVRSPLQAVPSIALGTSPVSPLDMASAFATLAAGGVRRDPVLVTRVENRAGRVLVEHERGGERAVDPNVARVATAVLQEVITSPVGTGRRADIGRPAAGKTGTSQEWRDAWFVGFTPHLAAAVWMGSPTGEVPMRGVAGVDVTGGTFPAQVWAAFMRAALERVPPQPL